MQIVERYLASIRSCLPEATRDDIVKELSGDLYAQIEDREASLGRAMTDAEVETVLKEHGHPMVVAGRYLTEQQSVSFGREIIGSVMFPFYIKVLKFNLGITTLAIFVVQTALFLGGHGVSAGSIFTALFYQVVIQFGVVTLIFAAIDRHWKHNPESWDPRQAMRALHPALGNAETSRGSKTQSDRVSRFDSAAQVIALCIALVWLRVAQGAPFLIFGPAAAFLRPAAIWHQFYWPVVVVAFLGIAQGLVNIWRPDWLRLMVLYRALTAVAWIVILFFILRAGHWVDVAADGPQAEGFRRTAEILNQLTIYVAAAFAGISVFNFVRHLRRLLRLSRGENGGLPARNGHSHA